VRLSTLRESVAPASGNNAEIIQALLVMRPIPKAAPSPTPPGFLYVSALLAPDEQRALVAWLAVSPAWNQVTFRGQTARRRAMSFGARYLTQGRQLVAAPPLPPTLVAVRDRMVDGACAGLGQDLALAGRTRADFALCTALHYPPGAAIGWHTDNRAFGPTILCLSLGGTARLQLRVTTDGAAGPAPPVERELAPGSLFVLAGEARSSWQHRICPVRAERYSLTLRAPAVTASAR
jgi:alkylated DNA repair protein (DNA oxidative demethylase)